MRARLRGWLDALAARHPGLAARVVPHRSRRERALASARDLLHRPRPVAPPRPRTVLVIDKHVPTPDRDSGSVRLAALIDIITGFGFQVVFAPATRTAREPYASQLEARGVAIVDGHEGIERFLAGAASHVAATVLSRQLVAEAFLPLLRERVPASKVVYDTVDLVWRRTESQHAVAPSRSLRAWARRARLADTALARAADLTLAITEDEAVALREIAPGAHVEVIPNIHELPAEPVVSPPPEPSLLFVGNFRHNPNVDAVRWFAAEVIPALRHQVRGVRFVVAGASPPASVRALAGADISIVGWAPDLGPLYRSARVVVAPLRYGAGMKGKVGEALSFGIPVVTTPVGAEGFGTVESAPLAVVSDAPAFATAIARLCTDDAGWEDLSRRGRRFVEDNLSRAAVVGRVERALRELGVHPG